MKNVKRLISAATSVAMAAAMFSGLSITANAETYNLTSSESAYVDFAAQDSNFNGEDQGILKARATQFRDWEEGNTAIGSVKFDANNKGTSEMPLWKFDISGIPDTEYIASATVTLTIESTGDGKAANQIRILGYNGEWDASTLTFANLSNSGGRDMATYLTGTVDGLGSFQPLNTTDTLSTSDAYPQTVTADIKDYLQSAVSADKSYITVAVTEYSERLLNFSTTATLNVETTTEALYDVTITTAPLATVKVNDTDYYSDKNGIVNLGSYTSGTEFSYSVTKSGYNSIENQTATVGSEDLNISAPLTIVDNSLLYYEDYISSGVADRGSTLMGSQRYYGGKLQVWANDTVPITGVTGNNLYTVSIAGYEAYTQKPGDRDRTKSIAFMDGSTALFTISAVMTGGADPVTTLSTSTGDSVAIPASGDISLTVGNGRLVGNVGDAAVNLSAADTVSGIDSMVFAGDDKVYLTMSIGTITISAPNPDYLAISGPANIAKLAGVNRTTDYDYTVSFVDPTETFTWGVSGVEGVTIDQDGVLTVPDTAAQGTAVITLESSTGKKTSLNVGIGDYATVGSYQIKTSKTLNTDGETTISVYDVLDENGADITEYVTLNNFTSDDTEVVTVDGTGKVTAVGRGTATVRFNIATGKDNAASMEYTVDTYYVIASATGESTTVDIGAIYDKGNGTYKITTSKDGKLVNETTVDRSTATAVSGVEVLTENAVLYRATYDENEILTNVAVNNVTAGTAKTSPIGDERIYYWNKNMTPVGTETNDIEHAFVVDTTDADMVEVAPVYSATVDQEILVPSAAYNITVSLNGGSNRTDIYVNDQMVINNMNQGSDNFTIQRDTSAGTTKDASDVVIAEGGALFNLRDNKGASVKSITFVKSPSIVDRAQHIYIIGDSLVADYYGVAPEGQEALVRTGWGQVLDNYIVDSVKVTNLGNSGAWAAGMRADAFTNVLMSAQPGDIMILESGYNDKQHSTLEEMQEAVTEMITMAYDMGLTTFLVNPNASSHGTGTTPDVVFAKEIRQLASDLGDKTTLIDLSQLSYNFLMEHYNGDWDTVTTYYNNSADKLHSTTNAANCWAAIVVQGLYDNGFADIVDTEYSYHFDDGTADGVTVQIDTSSSSN